MKEFKIDSIIKNGILRFNESYFATISIELVNFLISQGTQHWKDLERKLISGEITENDIENQIYTILETAMKLVGGGDTVLQRITPNYPELSITVNDLQKIMKDECKIFPWC